ncbi:hypothetical protein PZA11_007007 [Diplocarpon coronariae]
MAPWNLQHFQPPPIPRVPRESFSPVKTIRVTYTAIMLYESVHHMEKDAKQIVVIINYPSIRKSLSSVLDVFKTIPSHLVMIRPVYTKTATLRAFCLIPHFLEFVNTRLSDLRLRRNPSSPAPSPNFPPTLSGMPPTSLTPCLACLDQQVACAFHPDPQRYGVFNSIVAALTIQDRDPSLAIPCLACFDEETICAHHEAQNAETKTRALQVAQFCGSCRFAEQECDAVETGCGRCEEQELECLYVVGDASPADGLDSGVLPGHESSEVPRPPISCGGCRMAAIACDGLKPDCTACKDQGLDCMYIVGTTPPGPEPVFVVPNTGKYETDEITDDSESQLEGSEFVETTSRQSDATESQLGNSTILELSHDEESAAIDSGNSQKDELESGDWDIVSRNEEYELIEAGEKRGDSDEEDLGRGSRFW